jgi:hypothetical protein
MRKLLTSLLLLCCVGCMESNAGTIIGNYYAGGAPACLTDAFTTGDSTALDTYNSTYDSISVTWDVGSLEINSNHVEPTTTYNTAGAYYNSGSPGSVTTYASAVINVVSGANLIPKVCTRSGSSVGGYCVYLYNESAPNYTRLAIQKNNVTLGSYVGVSYATANPHTLYIKATDNGANVDLEAWVDTTVGGAIESETDSSSVIASGYPGFYYPSTSGVIWSLDDLSDCTW